MTKKAGSFKNEVGKLLNEVGKLLSDVGMFKYHPGNVRCSIRVSGKKRSFVFYEVGKLFYQVMKVGNAIRKVPDHLGKILCVFGMFRNEFRFIG